MPLDVPTPSHLLRPEHFCNWPGCSVLTRERYCGTHERNRWREEDVRRGSARERGYTRRWDRYRVVFLAEHPLCAECKRNGRTTLATIVDHIVPARVEPARFWDSTNHQALCRRCHDDKTATEENAERIPTTLGRPAIPLTVVCGPPAAGKSQFVAERSGSLELVVDVGELLREITGTLYSSPTRAQWREAFKRRNEQLAQLVKPARWHAAWLIATGALESERAFWRSLGAAVVVVETPLAECERRILADPRRAAVAADHIAAARRWWTRYRPDHRDTRVMATCTHLGQTSPNGKLQ